MQIFGLAIRRLESGELFIGRAKTTPSSLLAPASAGGLSSWFPIVREGFAGAWQQNVQIDTANVLTYVTVYACITLIASDIGKLRIKLVELDDATGIWTEIESPAFSPVLRKPNHYQTRIEFLQQWITSKYIAGNTYILKQRDDRKVVTALYILDPTRVRVLIADDGSVYYSLNTDNLTGLSESVIVPQSEIIHDVMVPLYHPLVGVSPITACGLAAVQGLRIQENSTLFFQNGASPGGILSSDQVIKKEQAEELKARWDANYGGANRGAVAVLGNGLKFEKVVMTAVDAQLIDQLKWTSETVCSAHHVPPFMVGVGKMPTYNNIEALNQQYYSQCLQNPIESIELKLDEGLGLDLARSTRGRRMGTELDLEGLLRMDTASRMSAAAKAIKAGMSPNEVRRRYHDLAPVNGGNSPMMQEQNFSLEALAKRDALADPFGKTPTPSALPPSADDDEPATEEDVQRFTAFLRKELAA